MYVCMYVCMYVLVKYWCNMKRCEKRPQMGGFILRHLFEKQFRWKCVNQNGDNIVSILIGVTLRKAKSNTGRCRYSRLGPSALIQIVMQVSTAIVYSLLVM